jgi:succinate dehydrogenase flavin-adding protein (antitoxin of CptAB toxin-antitoxin module)
VYPHLDADDRERYRKLLECEDQDMFGWFMQRDEPQDDDLKRIVDTVTAESKADARAAVIEEIRAEGHNRVTAGGWQSVFEIVADWLEGNNG